MDTGSCASMYCDLRDLGSLIGGILALVAGGIAYGGALHAANVQVAAVNAQTATLKSQNDEIKREARRKLARDGLSTARLMLGVVNRVREESQRLLGLLDQDAYRAQSASAPSDWRLLIAKPPLATVWSNLGACGPEIIEKYLLLDANIDEFASRNISGAEYMRTRAAHFISLAEFLTAELDSEAQRCNAILTDKP